MKCIAIEVDGRMYHHEKTVNATWRRVTRSELERRGLAPETTIHLEREIVVRHQTKAGLVVVRLMLNLRYHLHMRWFDGNDMDDQALQGLVRHHVGCWIDCALRARAQEQEITDAQWLERVRGRLKKMVLPGRIYRATHIVLADGGVVRALESEGVR